MYPVFYVFKYQLYNKFNSDFFGKENHCVKINFFILKKQSKYKYFIFEFIDKIINFLKFSVSQIVVKY